MHSVARLLAVCIALGGCSSGAPAGATGGTAVFSGAFTASVPVAVGASYSAQSLQFSVQSSPGGYPSLSFTAGLRGTALQAETYDENNNSNRADGFVRQAATDGGAWTVSFVVNAPIGSFSLGVTAVGSSEPIDGGVRWPTATGTLNATFFPEEAFLDLGVLSVVVTF